MKSEEVIESLIAKTKQINIQVENIKRCDLETLTWRENQNSWSILECIEHLNRYGDYYIPEIEKTLDKSNFKNEEDFKSGLLGNYFAKSIWNRYWDYGEANKKFICKNNILAFIF